MKLGFDSRMLACVRLSKSFLLAISMQLGQAIVSTRNVICYNFPLTTNCISAIIQLNKVYYMTNTVGGAI